MTDADAEMIAELERLNAERTQGEWIRPEPITLDDEYAVGVERGEEENSQFLLVCDINEEPDNYSANAAFIAAAANAMPRLLALAKETQAARAEAERLREVAQSLTNAFLDVVRMAPPDSVVITEAGAQSLMRARAVLTQGAER